MTVAETHQQHPRNFLGASRRLLLALGDRRLTRRYPIAADIEFTAIGADGVALQGSGRTVNLSTGGVLFESDRILPVGIRIELVICWPARLNDAVALNLCVSGRVARSNGNSHAIRIREHEFCLRGRYRPAGLRFRTPAVPRAQVSASACL
jgi:PilZ domain